MPMPNPSVIFALFESYITMRKTKWKLNELPDGKVSIPEYKPEQDERIKIDICVDILNQVNKAKNIKDWMQIAHNLHKHDLAETERYSKRGLLKGWGYVGSNEITSVLEATRAYIVHILRNDADYHKQREKISREQLALEKDKDTLIANAANHDQEDIDRKKAELNNKLIEKSSLAENEDKLTEFFLDCIAQYDAKPLGNAATEKDINDYIRNVENGFRPAKLCNALLKTVNQAHQNNVTTVDPAPAPTATATALPAPAPLASVIKEEPIVVKKSKERSPVKNRQGLDESSTDSEEYIEVKRDNTRKSNNNRSRKAEAPYITDNSFFPKPGRDKKDPNPKIGQQNNNRHGYDTRSKKYQ